MSFYDVPTFLKVTDGTRCAVRTLRRQYGVQAEAGKRAYRSM